MMDYYTAMKPDELHLTQQQNSCNHNVEQKKLYTKEFILYDSIYIKLKTKWKIFILFREWIDSGQEQIS